MDGYTRILIPHTCGHAVEYKVFGGQKAILSWVQKQTSRKCKACFEASLVPITGNTYPVRDAIKALGGRWDRRGRRWLVPPDRADEARRVVAGSRQ